MTIRHTEDQRSGTSARPEAANCRSRPVLSRLLASKSGNVLPILAASIMPMAAMIGGAVDMSRAYMVKSRLQHACDAGVLAGRRAMAAGTYTTAAQNQAQDFFDVNFQPGYNDTTDVDFDTNNVTGTSQVTGTASAVMPTTIMGMFGTETINIEVSCEAELNLTNTDVTFVLDVTGSMAQSIPNGSGGTVVKIEALRSSVMSFYDTLANAATGSLARIRYSFVPYSTNVNVGELLYDANPQWLVGGNSGETWNYQSRRRVTGWFGASWQYRQMSFGVHDFVRSIKPANPAVSTPSEINGNTSRWGGCIEERDTIAAAQYAHTNNGITADGELGAHDLNIDAAPTNTATKWRPYWPEVYFLSDGTRLTNLTANGYVACPSKARLLSVMTRSAVQTYVDGLITIGGTYHDVGLLWGARLASPQGLFASTVNASPGNGGSISRHMIFMTDGDLTAYPDVASMYGIEQHDRRITGTVGESVHLERRQRRYLALCQAIKAKGIRLWVIAFGTTLTADMETCASSGSSFTAANSASLNTAFQNIARQISELRLTQ